MKAIFTLIALCTGLVAQSQMATLEAEFNNFRWKTALNGSMFFDQENVKAGFEVPINSGIHALFAANFWIGGYGENDSLYITAERYCHFVDCQFGPGPLRLDGTPESNVPEASSYNRFWTVSKVEVEAHLAYFDYVNDPSCDGSSRYPGGYTPPADFISWPAMGASDDGFADFLAPFFDYNGDGIYNAENGDHPLFCGDMAVYSIMNDIGHRPTGDGVGLGLGVEVHTMYYAFDSDAPEVYNALFVNKRIINRSQRNYRDVYIGVWNEFDLGNPFDDYVGTDVQRSMVYVYNGSDYDEDFWLGSFGYGDDLPMLGMRILRGPLKDANGMDDAPISENYSRYGNQTTGWGDGIADNERIGLSSSLYHSHSGVGTSPFAPNSQPRSPLDYYDYLRSFLRLGYGPVTFGGFGFDPTGSSMAAKYMFPGLSDPLHTGTGGVDPNYPHPEGWTETTSGFPVGSGNHPGSRRMLASSGPFSFNAGDEQRIDFAYIFARDSHQPGTPVFETLQNYADAIVGMECAPLPQIMPNPNNLRTENLCFRLYPNPARNVVTLEDARGGYGFYTFYDMLGKKLMQGNTTGSRTEISLGHLPKGLYLIRYEVGGEAAVRKLVVQ